MKYQNEIIFDNEEPKDDFVPDDKDKENEEKENENKDKDFENFPFPHHLTKEEMEKRGFKVKTIRFTPFDLLLLLVSLFLFTLSGSSISGVSLIAVVCSAPLYAVLSYRIGNNFSFLIPIIALITSAVVSKSAISPLGTILATAMSFIILHSVNNKKDSSKTSVVVGCCVSMAIYLAALYFMATLTDKISAREIMATINSVFSDMENYTYSVYSEMAKAGVDFGLSDSELKALAAQLTNNTRALLPSVAAICFMTISYISASLLSIFARLFGAKNMLDGTNYEIRLSRISTTVYILCWLGAFLGTGNFGIACRNITTILTPALAFCGVKQIGEFLISRGKPKYFATLMQIISIVAALFFADIGISILMMFGFFHTFKYSERKI